ncbi:MAG TPA: aminotransferase class I/II-fold pyridoxal phosphate-dependent enzyme, partial [Oligoflexia bacterium]|nr:aminotransferase class I/II-fold pyridoxal phosphate-dependent enzyme [Oligoflexia bacterium]
ARFKVTPEALKAAITKRTKAFIINSPSNPTGMMYSKSELEALARVLEGTNVWVLSDEIYEKLVYEGQFVSFASLSKDAFSRTITSNGFSKSYAITGWRAGYAAGPKNVIDAMAMIQGQSTSGIASIVQKGALAALAVPNSEIEKEMLSLRKRRNLMCEVLRKAEDLKFLTPDGAFYVFVDVSAYLARKPGLTTDEFALALLKNECVGTVPGSGFGADGYLRLSFAVSEAEVREGTERLVAALKKI